jgi:hypothetical protein
MFLARWARSVNIRPLEFQVEFQVEIRVEFPEIGGFVENGVNRYDRRQQPVLLALVRSRCF